MTAQHTPGPWQTSLSDDTVVIHIGADGVHYEVATIDGDYNQPENWPTMEANARLIAAAPDLLEAAKIALNYIKNTESEFDIKLDSGAVLRAAIAKAGAA